MTDENLKPCPFEWFTRRMNAIRHQDEGFTFYMSPIEIERVNEAYKLWNTRAQEPTGDAVEALRKLKSYARSTDDNIPFHHFGKIDELTSTIEAALQSQAPSVDDAAKIQAAIVDRMIKSGYKEAAFIANSSFILAEINSVLSGTAKKGGE